jgi:hypothetical protein
MPQPKTMIYKDHGDRSIGKMRNPRKKGTPSWLASSWKWRESRQPKTSVKSDPSHLRVNPWT